ncbi:hypothetical protein HDV05_002182 [Chytridiales sp. JEL 0842]|nr:hypothetical protein HDV05_002182 [Chytridiales sp. JEL 0842]
MGLFKNFMNRSKLTPAHQRLLTNYILTQPSPSSIPSLPQNNSPSLSLSSLRNSPTPQPRPEKKLILKPDRFYKPHMRLLPSIQRASQVSKDEEEGVFKPIPLGCLKDREGEKEKLRKWMMGEDGTAVDSLKKKKTTTAGQRKVVGCDEDEGEGELDEFKMLSQEITERRQFLDDMIALGHGEKYARQVQAEIAVRIKRMEQLDKEATKRDELERRIRELEKMGGDVAVSAE